MQGHSCIRQLLRKSHRHRHTPMETCSWPTLMICLMQNWHILRSNYYHKDLNIVEQAPSLCSSILYCSHWSLLWKQQFVCCRSSLSFWAQELTNKKRLSPEFDISLPEAQIWCPNLTLWHSGYLNLSPMWAMRDCGSCLSVHGLKGYRFCWRSMELEMEIKKNPTSFSFVLHINSPSVLLLGCPA